MEWDDQIKQEDCFFIFSRAGQAPGHAIHVHAEMELVLLLNARGMRRIVGNHIEETSDTELAFIGPNLRHGWLPHNCQSEQVREVRIRFDKDLLPESLLSRNQLIHIRQLFEESRQGILFQEGITEEAIPLIMELEGKEGFESLYGLFRLLHFLSLSGARQLLSDRTFVHEGFNCRSRRLERAFRFMDDNFSRPVTLEEVSREANMPPASFCRFIKKHTGKNFSDHLVDIRLGHVSRMLMETDLAVADIAYACGFNNLANFNRVFKAKKGLAPTAFKRELSE